MANLASINCISALKNAALGKNSSAYAQSSKMSLSLLAILEREGVITGFRVKGRFVTAFMANSAAARLRLKSLKVVSKPSRPVFASLRTLARIDLFLGSSLDVLVILNTTKGVVTLKDAIRFGVGGELLFSGSSLVTELMHHKR